MSNEIKIVQVTNHNIPSVVKSQIDKGEKVIVLNVCKNKGMWGIVVDGYNLETELVDKIENDIKKGRFLNYGY